MDESLPSLWDSSTGLLKRFELFPTLDAVLRKVREEHQEFEAAALACENNDHVLLEAADLIVTVLNTLYTLDYSYDDFEVALWEVIVKNDSKNFKTHEVVNGTIERKGRVR